MDNFDIVYQIVDHLCDLHDTKKYHVRVPRIAEYASVSRVFQRAVESLTFKSIIYRDSAEDQARFTAAFRPPNAHRRALVRKIFVRLKPPCSGLTPKEVSRNTKHLTASVSSLFQLLHEWEEGISDRSLNKIYVHIACYIPEPHARDRRPALNHDDLFRLPAVRQITELRTNACGLETPHAATLFQLAAHTPNLEVLDVGYRDGDHQDASHFRLKQHLALATAILNLRGKLPNLRELKLHQEGNRMPWNHSFQCLDYEEKGIDRVCEALRLLVEGSTLKKLLLDQVRLSPDLFCDRRAQAKEGDSVTDKGTLWPSLEILDITTYPVAANGKWYSTGNPRDHEPRWPSIEASSDDSDGSGTDHDDPPSLRRGVANHMWPQHFWRRRLDPETWYPVLLAMMSARMPALRVGDLFMDFDASGYYYSGFTFGDRDAKDQVPRKWKAKLANKSPWTPPKGLQMEVDVDALVPPVDD
ncbi:hypothetical protein CkaCkLH20_00530 [Colletotrichum karsti]|uniref:F-box domain-containing protein n=1 Tax=Colletotrichum karsti TaxID=1095194 RepID=A0A9P6LNF6_9PEZI|nr:uncharacterized protein CkaCkLH20_00530 [Colletotrichum karsti]KAF9882494.1 hypothetical protein CkaCkLH20_00530 [Colletotrichum karsti]